MPSREEALRRMWTVQRGFFLLKLALLGVFAAVLLNVLGGL
jgi:hypothetical protein